MVDVSVVVPSRGGASRLPRLLDRLAAQSHADFEVVVVLDGDVDGSEQVLEAHGRPWLRPVVLPENRGRSAALNVGFSHATGRVLVRCDDDLEPEADYVARHAEAHRGEPVGVIGIYRNVLADNPYARAYGAAAEKRLRAGAYAAPPEDRWRYWAGNVSVSRETWDRVGPYDDTTFRAYGWEDVDWGFRLHQAGVPIVVDRSLETVHRAAATTAALRLQRAVYSGAAATRFEAKHPSAPAAGTSRTSLRHRVWATGVDLVARRLDERRALRAGRAADRLLPLVPTRAGDRVVGLLVQASFTAGHQHPERVGRAI